MSNLTRDEISILASKVVAEIPTATSIDDLPFGQRAYAQRAATLAGVSTSAYLASAARAASGPSNTRPREGQGVEPELDLDDAAGLAEQIRQTRV